MTGVQFAQNLEYQESQARVSKRHLCKMIQSLLEDYRHHRHQTPRYMKANSTSAVKSQSPHKTLSETLKEGMTRMVALIMIKSRSR